MNIIYRLVYPVLGAIILGLIIFLGYTLIKDQQSTETADRDETETQQDEQIVATFTRTDVAASNTRDNCMIILDENVYLIEEEYFDEHPAGPNSILNSCGGDVTNVFDAVHKSPESTARTDLQEFFVGTIVDENDNLGISTISIERVRAADDINSICFTVIDGSVYDIPLSWALEHPGGFNEIADLCGRDATDDFNAQHEGTSEALSQLENFYLGELAD
jgi:cytochrome b involved in lipid metabolism